MASALWPNGSTTPPRILDGSGPRSSIKGARPFHYGVVVPLPLGSEIKAALDYTVIFSGSNGTLGEQVVNQTEAGQFLYPHNQRGSLASLGTRGKRGDRLALVGVTGLSTGPHSCFRTYAGSWKRDADARDPRLFMAALNSAPGTPVAPSTAWMESEIITNRTTYLEHNRYDSWGPELVTRRTCRRRSTPPTFRRVDDTVIPISNTSELDALLDLYGAPYEKYASLGAGQTWSRARNIEAKLNSLLAK
jgi:hypothetical protein